jgi:hypothetical protein
VELREGHGVDGFELIRSEVNSTLITSTVDSKSDYFDPTRIQDSLASVAFETNQGTRLGSGFACSTNHKYE